MRTAATGGQPRSHLVNDLLTLWFQKMAEAHVLTGLIAKRAEIFDTNSAMVAPSAVCSIMPEQRFRQAHLLVHAPPPSRSCPTPFRRKILMGVGMAFGHAAHCRITVAACLCLITHIAQVAAQERPSELAELYHLVPGDVLVTGTPAGVGWSRKPPQFLKGGDTVEVEIEKIGVLRNPVVDE